MFLNIVIENTDRIVGPALVSNFSGSPAAKRKHLIIFQSSHDSNVCAIINFLIKLSGTLNSSLIQMVIFLYESTGSIKKERQLDAVRLRWSHRFIISLFIETFNVIFFC